MKKLLAAFAITVASLAAQTSQITQSFVSNIVAQGTQYTCTYSYYGKGLHVEMNCIPNGTDGVRVMNGSVDVPANNINGLQQSLFLGTDVFTVQIYNQPGTQSIQVNVSLNGATRSFTFTPQ